MMRFGLIGLGQMGRHHARLLAESPDVEFIGAVDPVGDRHHALREGSLFRDVADLLEAGVEAAVVATPTAQHREIAIELANHGVHTLIEKPLADTVERAKEIKSVFDENGVLGAVGHVERFNSALQEMKNRLEEDALGRVISISTERVGPFPHRVQDVGVVKDLATHDIDIAVWIGGARFSEINGQLAHKMGRPHEDLVVATGRLDNDVVVSIAVNWLTPVKRRGVSVLGEKGSFVADLLAGDLYFYSNADVGSEWDRIAQLRGVSEGDMVRYAFPKREPLEVEHEAFRAAVADGQAEGIVSLAEGVEILEVAEMIVRGSQ